jgi:general secretion pathway protein M
MRAQMKARLSGRAVPRDSARLYLASPSASLARAELLSLLDRLIDEAKGRSVETQMAPEDGVGAPQRIALQATLDIENDGLADLLHAIETGLPVLNVDEVTVAPAPRAERSGPLVLRVTLVIHGYWKAKAA